jgi:hypothetical protein
LVNPNVAIVSGMSVHANEQEAIDRGLDGFKFFGYSLGYYALYGQHCPGRSDVWRKFLEVKDDMEDNAGRGGIGTPDQVRDHLERYERAGIDQVIFVQQGGNNKHEHICESLELFGKELLPAFKVRDEVRERQKADELAPYIAAAMARKPARKKLADSEIPLVEAYGRQKGIDVGVAKTETMSDRGGGIVIPRADPHRRNSLAES